jgi:hypothetical protein
MADAFVTLWMREIIAEPGALCGLHRRVARNAQGHQILRLIRSALGARDDVVR